VHEFASLLFHVHFLREQTSGSVVEPSVVLDLRVGMHFQKWYGQDSGAFLRKILSVGGVVEESHLEDIEDRAPTLMQAFQERSEALLDRMAGALGESRTVADGWPRRARYHDSQLSLRLMPTADLVGEEVDTRQLADRYRNLLVGTLQAFFASEPTRPFAMLVAEACMPRMGRL